MLVLYLVSFLYVCTQQWHSEGVNLAIVLACRVGALQRKLTHASPDLAKSRSGSSFAQNYHSMPMSNAVILTATVYQCFKSKLYIIVWPAHAAVEPQTKRCPQGSTVSLLVPRTIATGSSSQRRAKFDPATADLAAALTNLPKACREELSSSLSFLPPSDFFSLPPFLYNASP
ncbi:uncharacterized protein F5Z01DRAFT_357022 [Emericellopsis atlantica]|uniref:Uncharacterized protein n=1 Tax=Emericellopsis atlantica TaxID=2614577 RepID=A0A9P7ZF22_9HYPO|nr:uncharacterized protein F5Z01DRAFT_357022 [Emericellopsis atlantica]KAG9250521.1 hypothetical protein F5Z01DRAFT_357022 [Emericellopsis atlantica]